LVKFGRRSEVPRDRIRAAAEKRRLRGLDKRRAAIAGRREAIVELLQEWPGQTAPDLVGAFRKSRDTIDADLKALEAEGLVVREGKPGGKVVFRATTSWGEQ
jgi:predicted HTH transcriptional regulator